MEFSKIYDYESDSGTKTNADISDGFLLTDGSSSGKWVSDQFDLAKDMTAGEIRASGTALEGTKYWVSTDGGLTFTELIIGEQKFLPNGRNIKVRVDLSSANTQINTLAFYYKL